MGKNDNLNDFLADVANAIRAKKGTSDLINPQDFSAEIANIEGGGSGGGGSSIEYLDVSGIDESMADVVEMLFIFSSVVRVIQKETQLHKIIPPLILNMSGEGEFKILYFAINFDLMYLGTLSDDEILISAKDVLIRMGITQEQLDAIPRLTKEQFYSLE